MSKNFWKYPNITTRKKRFAKTLKSFFLILGFLCFVFGLVCLLAPMFNLKIFEDTQKEFCTTYYIVYTKAKEDKDVFEYSQDLRFRGAGGNIVEIDKTNVVVLNEYKTEEKAKPKVGPK